MEARTCIRWPHLIIQNWRSRTFYACGGVLTGDCIPKHIIFKITLFLRTIRKDHATKTMLNTADPFTLIHTSICPEHLTITLPLILIIVPFINITTSPSKNAFAMLSVVYVISFIHITILNIPRTPPFTFSMLFASGKVASINLACGPDVLAFAVRFSICVLTSIHISISKAISPLSMLQAHLPLALIPVTIWPQMDTITMSLGRGPLSDIRIILYAFPDTVSLFYALIPLTIINLPISPGINTFSMCFSKFKLTKIGVAVWIPFETFAVSKVLLPKSLILSSIPIFHNTFSMAFSRDNCADVYRILITYFLISIYFFNGC